MPEVRRVRCRRGSGIVDGRFCRTTQEDAIDALTLAQSAANAVLEKKGENVVILHIGERSSFADYLVIVTAQSDRQVRALSRYIEDSLKTQGVRPLGTEGDGACQWVLVDYGEVVVHLFREDARMFYDLDGMWRGAPRVPVQEPQAASAE